MLTNNREGSALHVWLAERLIDDRIASQSHREWPDHDYQEIACEK